MQRDRKRSRSMKHTDMDNTGSHPESSTLKSILVHESQSCGYSDVVRRCYLES